VQTLLIHLLQQARLTVSELDFLRNGKTSYSSPSDSRTNSVTITASLFASVWKVKSQTGDVIQSDDEVLIILEAMKTEIPICAGEENVGKTIKHIAVKEGAVVQPGDVVAILD
jgi:biotin carboxyl carrier protein